MVLKLCRSDDRSSLVTGEHLSTNQLYDELAEFSQFDLAADGKVSGSTDSMEAVDYYLNLGRPVVSVLIMGNGEAADMYQACKRDGHKARVKFVSGGKAVVIYSPTPGGYKEVGRFARIRMLSKGGLQMPSVATVFNRISWSWPPRLLRSHPRAVGFMTAFFSACTVVVLSCVTFGKHGHDASHNFLNIEYSQFHRLRRMFRCGFCFHAGFRAHCPTRTPPSRIPHLWQPGCQRYVQASMQMLGY